MITLTTGNYYRLYNIKTNKFYFALFNVDEGFSLDQGKTWYSSDELESLGYNFAKDTYSV